MKVPYGYLQRQFAEPEPILARIGQLVKTGQLTLGAEVERFEAAFAEFIGARYAIGVGSGTDALFLSLKALGVGPGDEVITAVNTFVATAGAIETAGARLRFVDCNEKYVLDPNKLEAAISPKTKVIVPVHYTGQPVDMSAIQAIADRHGLAILEDACTAIDAGQNDVRCGAWGKLAAFSMHPIKNLHVWGDAGVICTQKPDLAEMLRLMRNHGMTDRDTYAFYAYNSRLDTLQAAVGNALLPEVRNHTDNRIANAFAYDLAFKQVPQITIPPRPAQDRAVYHMYMIQVEDRDGLLAYLKQKGVSAKVHYPVPLHLQPASAKLGYGPGDFPVAETQAQKIISLPVHPYLTQEEKEFVIEKVLQFYGK
ncbi:MAG: DegT/DnrJ/EryC1/StrS family aminotransferase [Acidobacteria bacterium]|nr:DegT/DnrJ/EryC1/StrS family aminotransferase [Acidobacteriota bacterium]MCB9396264.1 DegT/DnrJ/EryC1/StrS family aminotransferase [Acidobacteriota bacterium]